MQHGLLLVDDEAEVLAGYAYLAAAQTAAGKRSGSAREQLAEPSLLLRLADALGDLATARSSAIRAALDLSRGAASPA